MPEPCYRALIYLPGQLTRWNAGVYNSCHPTPHPGWGAIWAQKEQQNPGADHAAADFSLGFDHGRYTEQARVCYLQIMRQKGGENWTDAETVSASVLDGACAFNGEDGPARAYAYAASSGHPEDVVLVVSFMGEVVCGLPEAGGVLARVIEPLGPPLTAAEFREQHGLDPYEEPQAEQQDLFAAYELEQGPQIEPKRDVLPNAEAGDMDL